MTARVGVGIVGCGADSRKHLPTLIGLDELDVVAVADLDPSRAAEPPARPGNFAQGWTCLTEAIP
ncbi:hypothetical protein ACTMSW_11485 [Micromonospora sp. BQ11]|uniref:hypothetical protein n=1 Tax=Micromonospora sp. BQ11 TaxID=3452212 RepID=UPI003F8AAF9B